MPIVLIASKSALAFFSLDSNASTHSSIEPAAAMRAAHFANPGP